MEKITEVKRGDVFYSEYFNSWCQVTEILKNGFFYFKRNRKSIPLLSRIKTDYLIENRLVFRNPDFDYLSKLKDNK
jgi:hypothetical protein